MALFHRATITPTKAELIADWAPTRPWGPAAPDPLEVIGSYRFDDPDGRVGMETHLVAAGNALLQVPLTYRDERLPGVEDALITEMQHSVLGTRWVYDGLRDPRFCMMLAAVAMTGQGEALGRS
jgi:maltokinase-like protein